MKFVVPPRIVLLLSGAALASVLGAALSSQVLEGRRHDTVQVAASWRALAATERVQSLLLRTEAAWRDHMIRGTGETLARYTAARSEIQDALEREIVALPYRPELRDAWSCTYALVSEALATLSWEGMPELLFPGASTAGSLADQTRRLAVQRAEDALERVMGLERAELHRAERAVTRNGLFANTVVISTYAALLLLVTVAAYAVRGHLRERERRELAQQHALELQAQMIGIVGHDLRTPLSAIAGSAQVLARAPDLPSSRVRAAQRIVTSAGRMSRMLLDLLDFSRLRASGGIPVAPQPGHLGELCRSVLQEIRAARPESDVRLVEEGDLTGEWDAARLEQVISNLVANACHYGTPGRPVSVRATGGRERVVLEVRNEGVPIPPEVLPSIFDAYRRGSPERGDANGSVGLGLFIVRTFVEAHGGRIDVTSDAGGTTFTVVLPRASSRR